MGKYVMNLISFYENKEFSNVQRVEHEKEQVGTVSHVGNSEDTNAAKTLKCCDLKVESQKEYSTSPRIASKQHAKSSPVADSKGSSRRLLCAKEILFTEKTYVNNLLDLNFHYIQPLSKIVAMHEIHSMFGNIDSILNFNQMLLKRLEDRMEKFETSKTLLGDIFVDLVPYFSMYLDYCCNYEFGMQMISKFRQDNSSFRFILTQGYLNSNGKDIHDYCITPVQRVSRYRLLLENLLKHTSADHPDYENIKSALELVSQKVSEINKKMDMLKQQQKLIELNSLFLVPPLDGKLIQPWRYLDSKFQIILIQPTSAVFEYSNSHATLHLLNDLFILEQETENKKLNVLAVQPLWNSYLKKCECSWFVARLNPTAFQIVNPCGAWTVVIEDEAVKDEFKSRFKVLRDRVLTDEKRLKRSQIRLYPNEETQMWDAVERAPAYALNRLSLSTVEVEVQECTKEALKNLLCENWEKLKTSTANGNTPRSKSSRKSTFSRLKEEITKSLTPRRKKQNGLSQAYLNSSIRALLPSKRISNLLENQENTINS